MIQKNKKNKNNILLNLLFKSKNMYGESLMYTNNEILPFIYGSRYNQTIINLKNISFILKRIFKLIKYKYAGSLSLSLSRTTYFSQFIS